MFRTGYEIFVRKTNELEQDKEVEKEIRNVKTYERKTVKAIFSSSPDKLPDGEPLWLRGMSGRLLDENPWRIKIVSEA